MADIADEKTDRHQRLEEPVLLGTFAIVNPAAVVDGCLRVLRETPADPAPPHLERLWARSTRARTAHARGAAVEAT